jgi:hypothetical protein
MDALIDFVLGHLAGFFFLILGIGCVLYSCFSKRISFQGDFPLRPEERKTYEATSRIRRRAIAISILPLVYGLYLLLTR